jgi:saccharopine dehydrogenase-like NADP-dependent oxidoreductase
MKNILLFGAGKSASALIRYLLENAAAENWHLTVVDADIQLAREKTGHSEHGTVLAFDIKNDEERTKHIADASIVISLMPAALHFLIAKDCLKLKKNLLTASYVDEQMKQLKTEIEEQQLLFLCEMGLDPGIDHMSAKNLIDHIHESGGTITSFCSHCGGLLAPESDDNPWHYKISWNPRNVVMAGKAGAIYKKDGEIEERSYEELFAEKRYVMVPDLDVLCWYPNRDSLSYIPLYGMEQTATFVRTTLRHPDFIYGWNNVIDLKLTSEKDTYETDKLSLSAFFKKHMEKHEFTEWLEEKLTSQFNATKGLLSELVNLVELEQKATETGIEPADEFMMVDDSGDLKQIDIDDLKINAAATLADKMHDASLTLKQFFYLGMDDEQTMINRGTCTTADILQFALEQKLQLQPADKDMVVMLHEVEFTRNDRRFKAKSTLILKGEDDVQTAMAKTVGLPLGVATKLILNGTIKNTGLLIPVTKEIYDPVLQALNQLGIVFKEEIAEVP